ncbi:unnamed protein product, partial [Mesorhabditis belari]|uniref:SCP domain-containing protein n=1 Tax=Mesorhabditis belari TaxID=2138241 RepID=A0AAF3EPZ1_9BILA
MFPLFLTFLIASATSQFTQDDKNEIVDYHNNVRSLIALGLYKAGSQTFPPATNMMKMNWSSTLEQSAQNWANGCKFQHSGTNGVGENLYMVYGSNQIPIRGQGKAASASWEKEFQDNGWPQVPYFDNTVFNSGIGHATQLAWGNSNQIGCGAAQCNGGKQVIVVCQYTKPGNYLNQNAWAVGTRCAQCPITSTCDPRLGLCQ